MDVVYLIKHDPENNSEELRYSLRSLQNLPHRNVIIVGEKPDWVTNVTFFPTNQTDEKAKSVALSLRTAAESELVSDEFILMNDDFFIMKKISKMPTLNFGPMSEVITHYQKRYTNTSEYITNMNTLHDALVDRGIKHPLSYELHTPMVLTKENVLHLYNNINERLYQFRTFYGNYYKLGGESISDVKVFLKPQHNNPAYIAEPQLYLENQTFLSVTGGSFKRGLPGKFIKSKFTEKSIYEL